jgi:hypothetical protein
MTAEAASAGMPESGAEDALGSGVRAADARHDSTPPLRRGRGRAERV